MILPYFFLDFVRLFGDWRTFVIVNDTVHANEESKNK